MKCNEVLFPVGFFECFFGQSGRTGQTRQIIFKLFARTLLYSAHIVFLLFSPLLRVGRDTFLLLRETRFKSKEDHLLISSSTWVRKRKTSSFHRPPPMEKTNLMMMMKRSLRKRLVKTRNRRLNYPRKIFS